MDTEGIILLSDISGYTEFLTKTSVEHGNWIISNFFAAMLQDVPVDLKVVEVEGDALFCWLPVEKDASDPESIIRLVTHQFNRFVGVQEWLVNVHRCEEGCQCAACNGVRKLKIKFILHLGKVGAYKIGPFEKIGGIDVVIAHRLLKNSVPLHEYQLVTDTTYDMLFKGSLPEQPEQWTKGADLYPVLGQIFYRYQPLARNPTIKAVIPPFSSL
jgi:Protein of unknown function (DUF2652)